MTYEIDSLVLDHRPLFTIGRGLKESYCFASDKIDTFFVKHQLEFSSQLLIFVVSFLALKRK